MLRKDDDEVNEKKQTTNDIDTTENLWGQSSGARRYFQHDILNVETNTKYIQTIKKNVQANKSTVQTNKKHVQKPFESIHDTKRLKMRFIVGR